MHSSLQKLARAALALGALGIAACEPSDEPERASAQTPAEQLDAITQGLVSSGSITSGQPIPVAPGEGFRYFEVDGARCRNGSNAGVTVRRPAQPSSRVVIYLQGGGACFNTQTCLPMVNPDSIAESRRAPVEQGIFDSTRADNPLRDWNVVYVPYCTGDFHMGDNVASVPFGPSNQLFVGRKNLALILPSVVATFPGTEKVLITGSSAGGAGATASVAPIKRAFAASAPELYLINDAGPLLSAGDNFFNDYAPVAVQTKWKNLWGLARTILPECGAACATGNMLPAFARSVIDTLGRKPALVTGKQDLVVATLYANVRVDQYPLFGLVGVELRDALNDYRTRMGDTWSTYYVTAPDSLARQHMFLVGDNFYSVDQPLRDAPGGQTRALLSWVDQYLNGDDASLPDVGP